MANLVGEAVPHHRALLTQLVELRRPLDVELSKDGRLIAYTVAPLTKEAYGSLETRLWVGPVDGPHAAAAGGSSAAVPRFSPVNSSILAYASDLGHAGRMSLWINCQGELGTIEGSVEDIRWASDGRSLLVLAADLGADRASLQTATKVREVHACEEDPLVFRPAGRARRRLYHVQLASGETKDVTPERSNIFEFDWCGGAAIAVCTEDPSEGAWYRAWIGRIDIERGSVERLHEPTWQLQSPRISQAGALAWIEGISSDRGSVTGTVYVQGKGPIRPDVDATWIAFADETTLWFAARWGPGSRFGRLGFDGSVDEIDGGEWLFGSRSQPQIATAGDGTCIAAVAESPSHPAEVVVYRGADRRAVTSLNHALSSELLTVATYELYRWDSFDGQEIEGILVLPAGRARERLPLVVRVHGGPSYTWSWSLITLPAQAHPLLLANEGYAVLLPNPRGSTGRGAEFAQANVGDMGGADLQDVFCGIDALVEDAVADPERVAITGHSYGGYISAWAITQSDRFAAAIPCAGSTHWLSHHLSTNIGAFDEIFLDADPYDARGRFVQRSPVYHARGCTTPTLLMHGSDDLCVDPGQSVEFYNALVETGCEAELVIYPREGHAWLERQHQVDAWTRTQAWLARFLMADGMARKSNP